MFVRMVVLLLFHLGYAEFVSEEISECKFDEICLKFCCVLKNSEDFCESLEEKFKFFRNATLSDNTKYEIFCPKLQFISDELNYEVNDLN